MQKSLAYTPAMLVHSATNQMKENSRKLLLPVFQETYLGTREQPCLWANSLVGFGLCSKIMLEFHVLIHVLVLLPATIYDVSGKRCNYLIWKEQLIIFLAPKLCVEVDSIACSCRRSDFIYWISAKRSADEYYVRSSSSPDNIGEDGGNKPPANISWHFRFRTLNWVHYLTVI